MLKLDPKNTELLSQKQTILNQKIEETRKSLAILQEAKNEEDKKMAEGTKINEKNYRALQREIINTENQLKKLELQNDTLYRLGESAKELGDKIENAGNKINSTGNKLTTTLTLPIAGLATAGIVYDAQIEKYTSAFKTFLGDAKEAERVVDNIKSDAAKTPFDTASLIQANQMLISTGENADKSRNIILSLGDAVIATGGGNAELTRMAANLQQIKNAGQATALDIKQFAYAGIDIYGLLADYTGKTTAEVKDMAVSYDVLTEALKKANSEGGKYYNAMNDASETLTGQISQFKSEVQDTVGNLVKSLMPTAKKIIKRAEEWIKKFDSLSDTQKENIVRIGLMVAAAGPLIKIFGTVTTVTGKVVKGFGTFSQAIGVMANKTESSNKSVNNLAKMLKGITSPTGLALTGITALTAGIVYFNTRETEAQKQIKEFANEMSDAKKELDDYNNSIDKTTNANIAHIDNSAKLREELKLLVDENGKVKEGYESRVSFILNELNEALGTEYKLNGNIIGGYQDLEKEIDKVIEKKRAEIMLSAEEEKYKEAIKNQKQAIDDLIKARENLNGKTIEELKLELIAAQTSGKINTTKAEGIKNQIKAYEDAEYRVKTYTENVKNYTTDYQNFVEGNYDAINNKITTSTKEWTDSTLEEIQNSIKTQEEALESYKRIYEETGNEVANQSAEQAKTNLQNLANELVARTNTIGILGKDEIKAWATLASNNYEVFKEKMAQLPQETQQKLQAIADVVTQDKSVEMHMEELAEAAEKAFESNDSTKWGEDMIAGMARGIMNKSKSDLKSAVSGASNLIASFLHFSRPDRGPLHEYEEWMPDMVKGLSNTLKKSSPILENSVATLSENLKDNLKIPSIVDFGEYSGITNKVIDKTKTIFTTPNITINAQDELTPGKINIIIDTVNKRLGSQY